jgi:4a-hydroxytetrahydrobiopterin dehydratase
LEGKLQSVECVPCRAGEAPLSDEMIADLLPWLPGWKVTTDKGIKRLERTFAFWNFREALSFADRVGDLAEQQGHHPELIVEWGRVSVRWWTHSIGGLHMNDFAMAAKTAALFRR